MPPRYPSSPRVGATAPPTPSPGPAAAASPRAPSPGFFVPPIFAPRARTPARGWRWAPWGALGRSPSQVPWLPPGAAPFPAPSPRPRAPRCTPAPLSEAPSPSRPPCRVPPARRVSGRAPAPLSLEFGHCRRLRVGPGGRWPAEAVAEPPLLPRGNPGGHPLPGGRGQGHPRRWAPHPEPAALETISSPFLDKQAAQTPRMHQNAATLTFQLTAREAACRSQAACSSVLRAFAGKSKHPRPPDALKSPRGAGGRAGDGLLSEAAIGSAGSGCCNVAGWTCVHGANELPEALAPAAPGYLRGWRWGPGCVLGAEPRAHPSQDPANPGARETELVSGVVLSGGQ